MRAGISYSEVAPAALQWINERDATKRTPLSNFSEILWSLATYRWISRMFQQQSERLGADSVHPVRSSFPSFILSQIAALRTKGKQWFPKTTGPRHRIR